jgi:hypothetical protein
MCRGACAETDRTRYPESRTVMIEVNRRLYLDEDGGLASPDVDLCRETRVVLSSLI